MIEEYHFGSIIVDGKSYEYDIEVRSGKKEAKILDWWRKESHIIDVADIKRAADEEPKVIIIGTGHSGSAKVTSEAQDFIKGRGIELIIDNTEEAVKTFNVIAEESEGEEGKSKEVIGLFHLTC